MRPVTRAAAGETTDNQKTRGPAAPPVTGTRVLSAPLRLKPGRDSCGPTELLPASES